MKNSETLCEFLWGALPDALDESHKVQGGLFVGTLDQKEPGSGILAGLSPGSRCRPAQTLFVRCAASALRAFSLR